MLFIFWTISLITITGNKYKYNYFIILIHLFIYGFKAILIQNGSNEISFWEIYVNFICRILMADMEFIDKLNDYSIPFLSHLFAFTLTFGIMFLNTIVLFNFLIAIFK
jgi:hypothetical protein